jgi:hypothetical protein
VDAQGAAGLPPGTGGDGPRAHSPVGLPNHMSEGKVHECGTCPQVGSRPLADREMLIRAAAVECCRRLNAGAAHLRMRRIVRLAILMLTLAGIVSPSPPAQAAGQPTIRPLPWNGVGLDSHNVDVGPTTSRLGQGRLTPWLGTCSAWVLGIPLKVAPWQMLHSGDFVT